MPLRGERFNLTAYSLADEREVEEAIRRSDNRAIRALITMLYGDPGNGEDPPEWFGPKKGLFRPAEFCPVQSSTPSMTIRLTDGVALVNGGALGIGDWFLLFAENAQVTLDPAHATLTRHDVIYIVPKNTGYEPVSRETVDSIGNVVPVTDYKYTRDEFDLLVHKGTPGAAAPAITRTTPAAAPPSNEPGKIAIAVVTVAPAATSIAQGAIRDVRELAQLRMYPISPFGTSAHVRAALEGVLPASEFATPLTVYDAGGVALVPHDHFWIDKTAGEPGTVKYRKSNGTDVTIG